ncbi:MAG: hypothetical protein KAW09_07505, partial [Thermoplasmata archaeon]|nr:hypothetical protein [Thermoplasmata archaeon]
IDKATIVSSLLQTFGTVGDGIIHPESVWHNDSLPVFSYELDAADILLDTYDPWEPPDGPCRRDGTGCRSLPGIRTKGIGIMTPDADYDPWRAAAGTMLIQAMRDVGINAMSVPGTLDNLKARDFQMFIMNWIIDSYPPEMFSTFLYSRSAAQGLNYMGYQSDTFDKLVVLAQEELDYQKQIEQIKDAQGVVANDRPCDAMYFPKNIEAYRSDKLTNWTEGLWGSIYNYWSWLGVQRTPPDSLRITTSIQSAIKTDRTTKFTATVREPEGEILQDATVHVYVPPGDGDFIWGGTQSNAVSGQTDLNGQFKVTYDPPDLSPLDSKRTVIIYAKASHPDYPDSRNASTSIVVYPLGVNFLVLLIDMITGDLVVEGRSTVIGVQVLNQDDDPVQDANVTILSDPFADITPATGLTDVSGYINGMDHFEFKAPQVDRDEGFNISIRAEKSGYESAYRFLTLSVMDSVTQTEPPSPPLTLILAVVLVAAAVVITVATWMRRMRRGKDTGE